MSFHRLAIDGSFLDPGKDVPLRIIIIVRAVGPSDHTIRGMAPASCWKEHLVRYLHGRLCNQWTQAWFICRYGKDHRRNPD